MNKTNHYKEMQQNDKIQDKNTSTITNITQRDELITSGFLRYHAKICNISLPNELRKIVFTFYHFNYEILQFSSKYTCQGFKLSNNNKCAERLDDDDIEYAWICGKDTVYEGIHCWRSHHYNPSMGWVTFAISHQKLFTENSYGQEGVVGFANNDVWYDEGCNKEKLILYNEPIERGYGKMRYLREKENYEIDILLDCNTGRVNFCMVGETDKFQPKFWDIDNFDSGWVPHFNLYYASKGAEIQIAKIDPSLYGKPIDDIVWK